MNLGELGGEFPYCPLMLVDAPASNASIDARINAIALRTSVRSSRARGYSRRRVAHVCGRGGGGQPDRMMRRIKTFRIRRPACSTRRRPRTPSGAKQWVWAEDGGQQSACRPR